MGNLHWLYDILLVVAFVLIYFLLIWKAGKIFSILYLFLFVYFLQYIFSTYLIYNEYDVLRVQMPIKQEQYFTYALPACLFLFAGVFLFNRDVSITSLVRRIDSRLALRMGYLLLIISYTIDFIAFVGITPSLTSIFSFTTYLKYLAAFCFLFTASKLNYAWIVVIYMQLAFSVLQGGVFIDFFVWSTYLFFLASVKFNFSFWLRASFILIAAPILILIQGVKKEYRTATWINQKEASLTLLTELAIEKNKKNADLPFSQSDGVISTVGRLSQGWHLGLTLKRVPKVVPLSDGQELLSDVTSSLLPRVLFPEKKTVGSQEKFYKYTGHKLSETTAMTIGVVGDFYINFGRWGSYLALFIFGAVVAKLLYYFITRYVLPDPINIIWVPFILSYLIRANNDFYMVFNCLFKGFLIFLFVNYLRKQLWPARLVK